MEASSSKNRFGKFDNLLVGQGSLLGLAASAPIEAIRTSTDIQRERRIRVPQAIPPPQLLVGAQTFTEAWKEMFPETPLEKPASPKEVQTFAEMFRAKFVDVIDFIALIHRLTLEKQACQDDWSMVSAMEIDLLMDITPENMGVVIAMLNAFRDECKDGTYGFPAWRRLGRKILSRCRKLGFVMIRPSACSDIERNENGNGWVHIRRAFITRKDTVGPWETCYVMQSPQSPGVNESILVPAPTCRPQDWTAESREVATELPCAFILVHPDLGLADKKE